jgi:hypothetical protein
MPDPLKEGEQFQRLTLKSKAGYLLVFEFAWKDGFMQSAKLYPKINPFGGNE